MSALVDVRTAQKGLVSGGLIADKSGVVSSDVDQVYAVGLPFSEALTFEHKPEQYSQITIFSFSGPKIGNSISDWLNTEWVPRDVLQHKPLK